MFDKGEIILEAEKNKKIVGYIVLTKKGEIAFFAVDKKFQGRGIGKNLLKKCFDLAKKRNLKNFFLDVRQDNKKAVSLYKKFGFKVVKKYLKKINDKKLFKLKMRNIFMDNLESLREKIDKIDKEIFDLIEKRIKIVEEVAIYKKKNNIPIFQKEREEQIFSNLRKIAEERKLEYEFLERIMKEIISFSRAIEEKIV